MRAAIVTELGTPPSLGEAEEPSSTDGAVVVDVLATGRPPIQWVICLSAAGASIVSVISVLLGVSRGA